MKGTEAKEEHRERNKRGDHAQTMQRRPRNGYLLLLWSDGIDTTPPTWEKTRERLMFRHARYHHTLSKDRTAALAKSRQRLWQYIISFDCHMTNIASTRKNSPRKGHPTELSKEKRTGGAALLANKQDRFNHPPASPSHNITRTALLDPAKRNTSPEFYTQSQPIR